MRTALPVYFDRFQPVPCVQKRVFFAQDRFEQPVVAVIVLGDQNHQFVLFDRDDGILLLRPLRRGLSRNIGQDKPEF